MQIQFTLAILNGEINTINSDDFKAILAVDSYNCGYDANIKFGCLVGGIEFFHCLMVAPIWVGSGGMAGIPVVDAQNLSVFDFGVIH